MTNANQKTKASGSEEECHNANDILTVGHAVIGDCSKECKTDSELEHFGVLKYNNKDKNDTAEDKSIKEKAGTVAELDIKQSDKSKKNIKTKEKKESYELETCDES